MIYILPKSICERFFSCPTVPIKWDVLLKLVSVADADADEYINICYHDRDECDDYEQAFDCIQDWTLEQILKKIIKNDDCGNPAIQVLANICTACEDEEEVVELP